MMKVKINSKKGLKTSLSVLVDKKTIEKKLEGKLSELQSKANLKGFRPGKVPLTVIKNQFGKAIYGEVVDNVLKETCAKAIEDNKIKVAGQPKIDLKTFGEGKDLNYTIELEALPNIKLKPLDKIKAIDYEISIEKDAIEKRINEIAKNQQNFSDKQESEKANFGDLVIFDYTAMVDSKNFDGNEGKGTQLILGRDLFIKGFDNQLLGSKKNEVKSVEVKLPENYPKKELANKKANFNCKIINIKKPIKTKIDNDFAKKLGAKDIDDLKNLIKKQITSEYQNSLNVITKKDILKQLESSHSADLPQNLIEQETKIITQNLKKEDIERHKDKNVKLAKSRIKIGLILNEIGEKNNLKINEDEIRNEIQKHIKNMPGQENVVMKHYQKNPSAVAGLRGVLYEDKIIELIKSKITLTKKSINLKEAEEILKNFTHAEESLKTNNPKKKQQKLKTIKKK
mgnify:FL=1